MVRLNPGEEIGEIRFVIRTDYGGYRFEMSIEEISYSLGELVLACLCPHGTRPEGNAFMARFLSAVRAAAST